MGKVDTSGTTGLADILENKVMTRDRDAGELYTSIRLPFEFKIAAKPDEIEEILRLRFLSYADNKYINPDFFPEGLEYDKYDKSSVMFLARSLDTGILHGCVRLVLDSEYGLPLEELVDIKDFKSADKTIVEMSRLISYPKGQPLVNRELLVLAHRYALENGITHMVGFGRYEIKGYYDHIGFLPLEPLRIRNYGEKGNGHMPKGLFYASALDVRNFKHHNEQDDKPKPERSIELVPA